MKKALLIGLKDLRVAARDRAALLLMLAAPFVLALGLGLVTGELFSSGPSGLQDIPVIIVNHDGEQLGESLVATFTTPELQSLLEPTVQDDAADARAAVESDTVAAAVIIPAGFTASIIPGADGAMGPAQTIEVYANPARPISSGVVEAIVSQFLDQVESAAAAGQVAIGQMLQAGLITPQEAPQAARDFAQQHSASDSLIALNAASTAADDEPEDEGFSPLAIFAPGMAILFLMYTVTYGGTSLLQERRTWTLQRLLTTPTSAASVLGGKVFGIFLTGFVQLLILIFGTGLLFGLNWGPPLTLIVLIAATVLGATGWGLLLASLVRTPGQVATIGSALMLMFGILGGSFLPADAFPAALRSLRLITPNAWAFDAILDLVQGATLADISGAIVVLLLMGLILGAIAVFIFRRRQLFA